MKEFSTSDRTRRQFLHSSLLGGVAAAISTRLSLFEKTSSLVVPAQREGMNSGRFTARSLAQAYLARIEAADKHGPAINAIIEINQDVLEIADALDAERKTRGVRGPLHGIPLLIKDNVGTADRMTTTAGSMALAEFISPRDAFIAHKLREAGAVILGKTNLTEWANFRSSHSISGWSARGGQTKNPYALNRNPCGSSSGSGVAVSANLCAVALCDAKKGCFPSEAGAGESPGEPPSE